MGVALGHAGRAYCNLAVGDGGDGPRIRPFAGV
jgi:hypothetical protein